LLTVPSNVFSQACCLDHSINVVTRPPTNAGMDESNRVETT
jgi:hypothetical protein